VEDKRPKTVQSVRTVRTDGKIVESADKLEPGMQFGRYVIRKMLGEGGMGAVYSAYDPTLARKIAIKVLRVSNGHSDVDTHSARARMLREAQAMAMVGHPNLVQVFDVGTYMDDIFIAMEFVEGVTLRDWLANHDRRDWEAALKKFIAAARGLAAAHARFLIHRDFKPENVMVDGQGHVRVMDFGLARHTGQEDPEATSETPPVMARPLTQTGMIMGTPAYMAPEQFLADYTDHRTDQFAFCVALFEALYGYRPFPGESMKVLARNVMRGEIILPSSHKHRVPDYVLTALLKGLQTDPEDRHENMGMLSDALTVEPDDSNSRPPWLLYLASILVALIGVLLYLRTADEDPQNSRGAEAPLLERHEGDWEEDLVIPPATQGVITDDQMLGVIAHHQEDIDDCVAQGRKRDPELSGYVKLKFEVHTSKNDPKEGTPERVLLEETDLFDQRAARCILGMSMNWDFPAPRCQADPGINCVATLDAQIDIPPPKEGAPPPKEPSQE